MWCGVNAVRGVSGQALLPHFFGGNALASRALRPLPSPCTCTHTSPTPPFGVIGPSSLPLPVAKLAAMWALQVLAVLALALACANAEDVTPKLSDERVVFQTKHGDFEFAFYPEVCFRPLPSAAYS